MESNQNMNLGSCNIIRKNTKWYKYSTSSLRINSPRTQEACTILGYDINSFNSKTLADFD